MVTFVLLLSPGEAVRPAGQQREQETAPGIEGLDRRKQQTRASDSAWTRAFFRMLTGR